MVIVSCRLSVVGRFLLAGKDSENKKAPARSNLPELFDFSTHQLSDCKAMPE